MCIRVVNNHASTRFLKFAIEYLFRVENLENLVTLSLRSVKIIYKNALSVKISVAWKPSVLQKKMFFSGDVIFTPPFFLLHGICCGRHGGNSNDEHYYCFRIVLSILCCSPKGSANASSIKRQTAKSCIMYIS